MKTYKFNEVFDHVEKTLYEYFGNNKAFDDVVFILGYNVLPNIDFLRKQYPKFRLIAIQLEQLHKESLWVNRRNYQILKSVDEVWDYDHNNIKWMLENYKIKAKFFPMLYTSSLKTINPIEMVNPDIDVLFYGYTNERRAKLFYHMQHKFSSKIRFFNLYGVWGNELNDYISRSKIILNVHTNEIARQEQVRMYHPVINGRCVLSEKSDYNYLGKSIVECSYADILTTTLDLLKNDKWKQIASSCEDIYSEISKKHQEKLVF